MDEKLAYCQGCLSNDRKMFPLVDVQPLVCDIELREIMSATGRVCWECLHLMRKFSRFKAQVRRAQELLCSCVKVQHLNRLRTLSAKTKTINMDYYQMDPLTNNEEAKAKADLDIKEEMENFPDFDEPIYGDYEEKPAVDSDIYVEIWNSNVDKDKKPVKKYRKPQKVLIDDEEEVMQKFTTVVFTKEEMLRIREEKRSQPNFKKIPYKCDSCVLGFTRKDTYDVHMKKKHDETIGVHMCPVCESRFPSAGMVARHSRAHYLCYRCRLCAHETRRLRAALRHARDKHAADSRRTIHCRLCAKLAKTPEEMAQHVRTEHAVYCNECGEKFKGPNTLRSHKRRIHGVKREFVCDICAKTFKSKSRLESHVVSHSAALAQKLAYCAPCRVQYKNIYVYRNHLKTSANHAQQTYQCRDCNKKFASKVYWKKHYNFYHLHKSQYHCELCNKLFISEWRLKSHRQTRHGMTRSRDHHCNVCGKQFYTLSTLKGHQLTHSSERTFMCEDCGDTFKQRPALYTHCRLVHKGLKRRKKP